MGTESEAAKAVARDILQEVMKGNIPHKGNIQRKHGYSENSIKSSKCLRSKTYKKVMQPIIEKLEEERNAILEEMKLKRGKAGYSDLVRGLDVTTKNVELLSGRDTARVGGLVDEIFKRL